MPSYPPRASQQRLPPASYTFAHDDVNAFRLRPVSYANTTAAPPSVAATSISSLPHLQISTRDKATATTTTTRSLAKAGPEHHSRRAAQPTTAAALISGIEAIRVPPVAAPRVYAALVPARVQPNRNNNSGNADASQQTAKLSSPPGAEASATGGVYLSLHDALVSLPVAATECIVAPDLSPTETRQMALWMRSTPSFTSSTESTYAAKASFNHPLHRWWHERQTIRLHHRHVAALDEELSPVLEQAVRGLLTAEEHHWQLEIQRQQQQTSRVPPTPSAESPVPLHKMAALLQALQVVLHQTSTSFIEAQDSKATAAVATVKDTLGGDHDAGRHTALANTSSRSTEEADEVEAQQALSEAQRHEVLQAALNTERALAEEVKRQAPTDLPTRDGVSVVTLPCDSPVPASILRLEAAVSVALLSSMIEKAEACVPGMEFAGHLFRQYILPHVYTDYAGWAAVRPRLGTLSEQVTHLATLPLRVQQQQSLTGAAVQAQADTSYLEGIVKSWTMRAWVHQVIQQRQSLARQVATERVVARLRGRVRLQSVFSAWRQEVQRRQQRVREARMEAAYINFLNESRLSAQQDSQAHLGNAATVATALLICSPQPSAPPVAAMQSRGQQQESGQGVQEPTAGSREGSSTTGVLVSAASTVVDTRVGWAQASLPLPLGRPRHDSHAAKRKGAGHSRVPLSFMRQKAGGQESARQPPQQGVGAAGAGDSHGSSAPADKDSVSREKGSGGGGVMEKYIVRDASSEDQDEGSSEENDAIDGAGTLTQLVYLESRADETHEDNRSYHARSTAPYMYATSGINASMAETTTSRDDDSAGVPEHPLFQAMLAKLREMDHANLYLRTELTVQSRRLRKIEAANSGLRQRNRQLEEGTLQLLRDKLEALNTTQEQLMTITQKNRRLQHLQSRLRAHRHRPWQSTVLRVVGDMCEVSTAAAEDADEARVQADRYGTGDSFNDDDKCGEDERRNASSQATKSGMAAEATVDGQRAAATMPRAPHLMSSHASSPGSERDEERLFSRIAPTVLRSTCQLPDALIILADWANSCLDDLQCLDDMKDGPLAERFSSFSEEARSGVLLSRLLYYLALPRYRTTTSAAEVKPGITSQSGMDNLAGARLDGIDRRRQLLEQHGVQLNPPFPVYAECFGDLLAMPPAECMSHLLTFATELMTGQDVTAQQQDEMWWMNSTNSENSNSQPSVDARLSTAEAGDARRSLRAAAAPPPTLSAPLPLHTVVDPYAVVRGERSAVITLISLLYVRFAHPFHHKSRQNAKRERSALLHLWSGGQATAAELNGTTTDGLRDATRGGENPAEVGATLALVQPTGYSIEADMLRQLPTEDKTPWQLFRERCLPVFGTQAHPFLLRGGFWPSDAFESPELAAMLSNLAMALRRSLELHRWHVTLSCLVPVRTYGGLSRGVFTGPCASAPALLLGLRQDGKEILSIKHPLIRQCVEQRQKAYLDALASETLVASLTSMDDGTAKLQTHQGQLIDATTETESLTYAITGVWQNDLLSLFVQRATLSAHLALPVLDLGSWRMLCSDLGLISMASSEREDFAVHDTAKLRRHKSGQSPMPMQSLRTRDPGPQLQAVDMEVVTELFQRAVMAVSFARGEVDPAVLQPARAAGDASPKMAPGAAEEHSEGDGRPRRSPQPSVQQHALPDIQMDMTYASFVIALVLLAHRLYPSFTPATLESIVALPASSTATFVGSKECSAFASSDDGLLGWPASLTQGGDETNPSHHIFSSKPTYCSLMKALGRMMQDFVLPSSAAHLQAADPRFILHQLTRGVKTQAVLQNSAPALLLVYQAYSKEVLGEPGMVRKDVLRLLRDAMLTSTELSQYLIYELFSKCSVLRQANEEVAITNRKEADRLARLSSGLDNLPSSSRRPLYRAVRIVDPGTATDSADAPARQRRRTQVLTFEGFCDLLCVLCGFKQPNVFDPFEERLRSFLHHSLLRPLMHMVPSLGPLLSYSQLSGASSNASVVPGAPGTGNLDSDGISRSPGGKGSSGASGARASSSQRRRA
ncbi:hypothetical protein LPMP_110310 [Leishmania panamensis]|uniref:Uncharacterized protein n=1 Tax=Leishmania panamensis TaxID=5679 RepID=A0A088RJS0_LEIPA|nr:hypothetical protein LPMP_110310 [Leishmania panamensis]AIN96227.1 hypothetical protein LPMP_110310 [Leishmania panamensis]